MYLKSLTLKGFKSFAKPTTFTFEPGVTAIVGPNGSGKSNVVDALAWVMGEQGAKTLRGGKMEDVIFAGTATKGPLGRAEVQLTINNEDGALPIDYSEVTISRTLFRNGQSEYAINGSACRLLDVQELLSDTGLGREMHVIVGQGQLDAVLRANPQERRAFIEEAAGILKHRRRKERTLRKLQAMEQNVTRLKDLETELQRQLKPLAKQAKVARRAAEIQKTLREAKARLFANEYVKLSEKLAGYRDEDASRKTRLQLLEDELAKKREEIALLEKQRTQEGLDNARKTVLSLESAAQKAEGVLAQAEGRLSFLLSAGPFVEVGAGPAAWEVREAAAKKELAQAALQPAKEVLAEAKRVELEAEGVLAGQLALREQAEKRMSGFRVQLADERGRIAALEAAFASHGASVARAEKDLCSAGDAFAEAKKLLAESGLRQDAPGEERLAGLCAQADAATLELAECEEKLDAARQLVHGFERQIAEGVARVKALERLVGAEDAESTVLASGSQGVSGRVADVLRVRPGFETAVAALLGVFGEAVVADSAVSAAAAVELAAAERLGCLRVVFPVVKGADVSAVGEAVDVGQSLTGAGVVSPVFAAVAAVVEDPGGVRELLHGCFIAEDLSCALERLPGLPFGARVATRAGEVLSASSLSGGSKARPSRIEVEAELVSEREMLAGLRCELSRAQTVFSEVRDGRDLLRARVKECEGRVTEARLLRVRAGEALKSLEGRCVRAEARLRDARLRLDELHGDGERLEGELVAAREVFAGLEGERPESFSEVGLRDCRAVCEAARESVLQALLRVQTLEEAARAACEAYDLVEARVRQWEVAAAKEKRSRRLRELQLGEALFVKTVLPGLLAVLGDVLGSAREGLREAELERARQGSELTLLRADEAGLRERAQSLNEGSYRTQLGEHETKLFIAQLVEKSERELGVDVQRLVDEFGVAELDCELWRQRLATSERELTLLGVINPLALEEYEGLLERHEYLVGQLQDLGKARKDLLAIIAGLDARMVEIFSSAFEDTRQAFAEVFPVLFPGGSGEISLVDGGDALSSGIEVAVRPAGKKVERLSLLSGGERSLAAVAWLVAIFRARPGPFYIMDEVEAALDDANLGRLLSVFEGLRRGSQLIVITHQKRTMEIADALYGVSMRKDGVSKVVGQRLAVVGDSVDG